MAEVPQEAAPEGLSPEDAEQLRTAIQGGRGQDEAEIRADERRRVVEEIAAAIEAACPMPDQPHTVPCDYQDAARIAREALGGEGALAGSGLVVTGVCACGQPLGTCPGCGDPRCWRCDPESDGCHAETAPAHARVKAARRMLDAAREELGRERVEHGAVVAVLAGVRALAKEWEAAGEDPVEPSDEVVAECGRELLGVVGPDAEGLCS